MIKLLSPVIVLLFLSLTTVSFAASPTAPLLRHEISRLEKGTAVNKACDDTGIPGVCHF